VPKANIKEDQIHYAKTNTVPQSRASKQGALITLLHTESPSQPPAVQRHLSSRELCNSDGNEPGQLKSKKFAPEAGVSHHAPVCTAVWAGTLRHSSNRNPRGSACGCVSVKECLHFWKC